MKKPETKSNTPIIKLVGVHKSFGDRQILKDVTMEIKNNSFISIMGESGAGKSTLLNILGFLDTPSLGTIYYKGVELKHQHQKDLIRNQDFGFVFQAYNLIPKLTVYENIALPICYTLAKEKEKRELFNKVPQLIQKYGLSEIQNSYVENLSGGEKQRVCLARATSCNAEIIISDEPTGNLDDANAKIVFEELKKMNAEGKTIILVTHNPKFMEYATDKYFIQNGRLEHVQ